MKLPAIVAALFIGGASLGAQNDPLRAARDLYASAAYEEALAELSRVGANVAPTQAVALETDAYRAFCMVALGRGGEAETIAESLVRRNPMLAVDQYRDVSPRLTAMFATVRKRMMPQLIREEYRTARARIAEKGSDAESRLTHVREMLAEAQKMGAWDETLDDVETLVDGFLELSRASGRDVAPTMPASSTAGTVPRSTPAASSPPAPVAFRAEDAGIVAPVAIFQDSPRVSPELLEFVKRLHRTGKIDVVIDERGSVDGVIVTQSVNPAYDSQIVAAARTWRYRPAMKDGIPVRFVKTVVVNAQ